MAQQIIDTTTPQPGGKMGDTAKVAFGKVNDNFAELYNAVANIPEDVTGDIEALDSRVSANEGAISALDVRVTTNEGTIGSLDTRVSVSEGAISSLDTRVTANEGAISALRGYIDGLRMEWVSGTSLRVTGGAAYVPGLQGILGVESPITKSGLSLSANTWYHLYLYRNGGSADIEISTTEPAEPYSGTARTKNGDNTRRYIGSVVTDASGAIYSFSMSGNGVFYGGDYLIYPKLRVLSYGTASDWTAFSFADVVPVTARMLTLALVNTGTAAFRVRPTFGAWTGTSRLYGLTANATSIVPFPVDSNLQGAYQCAPGGTGVVDVAGYTVER